jgi:poly(3-hydroxyalkanoate) depolymerase
MKARAIEIDGLRLNVATREGEGTPLLLATGIGAHIEMWEPFARRLTNPLIAFDAPGTGRSQRAKLPQRMSGLIRVVTALLDTLGHDRVDALGYSFGGGLVQELAHRAPERVRRIVLCATAPGLGSVPPKPVAGLMLLTPARYYHPALFRWTVPHIAGGKTRRDPSQLKAQATTRLAHPPSPLGYAYQLYATAGWTSLPWLHSLKAPTLVVAGDEDPVIPLANARILARRIPDARLHVVRGGGHLFLLDQPEDAVGPIQDFLSN